MSDYQDLCDIFGFSAGDPDAIDKIINMLADDECDDCDCDDPTNCPKEADND